MNELEFYQHCLEYHQTNGGHYEKPTFLMLAFHKDNYSTHLVDPDIPMPCDVETKVTLEVHQQVGMMIITPIKNIASKLIVTMQKYHGIAKEVGPKTFVTVMKECSTEAEFFRKINVLMSDKHGAVS